MAISAAYLLGLATQDALGTDEDSFLLLVGLLSLTSRGKTQQITPTQPTSTSFRDTYLVSFTELHFKLAVKKY